MRALLQEVGNLGCLVAGAVLEQTTRNAHSSVRTPGPTICLPGPVYLKRRARKAWKWVIGFAALSHLTRPAAAQVIDLQSVDEILIDEEGQGADIGGLRVYPAISAEVVYDDNIFNRNVDRLDDFVLAVRPSFTVGPRLERHDIRLRAEGLFARHADITSEDSDQFNVALVGRFDLAERTTATLQARYSELIEGRGTFGDQFFTDEPISYRLFGARAGLARRGAVWGVSAQAVAENLDFDEATTGGIPLDLSFRDLSRYRANAQVEYRFGPRLSSFARVGANRQRYDVQAFNDRDSTGGSALAGFIFQPSEISRIEMGLGYVWQNFSSPVFDDFSGIDYFVNGQWALAERLRVEASGQRSIERSPIPETAAVVRSNFDLGATYALSDQIAIGARSGVAVLDYRGIDRRETRYRVTGTIEYRLNEQLTAFASAGYRKQTSNDLLGREYDGVEVGVGIGFRL